LPCARAPPRKPTDWAAVGLATSRTGGTRASNQPNAVNCGIDQETALMFRWALGHLETSTICWLGIRWARAGMGCSGARERAEAGA